MTNLTSILFINNYKFQKKNNKNKISTQNLQPFVENNENNNIIINLRLHQNDDHTLNRMFFFFFFFKLNITLT